MVVKDWTGHADSSPHQPTLVEVVGVNRVSDWTTVTESARQANRDDSAMRRGQPQHDIRAGHEPPSGPFLAFSPACIVNHHACQRIDLTLPGLLGDNPTCRVVSGQPARLDAPGAEVDVLHVILII